MDITLTAEQKMLQQVAREWLADRCPKSLVAEMETDDLGYRPALWREMADNGWLGLIVPEAYGGTGMSFLDLVVLLEEMGRACLPGPYFSTCVLAALAIMEAGSEQQKNDLLPKIAQGDLLATLALTETAGDYSADATQLRAATTIDGFVLDGVKLYVPDAKASNLLITAANADAGVSLFVVDAHAPGVTITPLQTIAGDKQYEVVFDRVAVPAASVLGELGKGPEYLQRVLDRAAVAKCAESVGGCQQALEMSVQYAKDRVQFGRPIGSFQVVQHNCVNMATDVDCSRLMTYQAAWRLSAGLPAGAEVAMAKAWVSEAYKRVTALAVQIHGAIGFTMEHDIHFYFRRAKTAEVFLGDAGHHRKTVAREMGLAGAASGR